MRTPPVIRPHPANHGNRSRAERWRPGANGYGCGAFSPVWGRRVLDGHLGRSGEGAGPAVELVNQRPRSRAYGGGQPRAALVTSTLGPVAV